MFESFYHLSGKPFSLLPDSDFLYLSDRHRRAISFLEYGIVTQAGFVVITGAVGAGKTTIIRRFLKNANKDVTVGLITNPSASLGRLLTWVATAFGLEHKDQDEVTLYNSFVEFLLKQYAEGKRTILIIDEAQNLRTHMLEELRMLSNVNNEKDQLLQIVLVGQPELHDTLGRPNLRQFVQRISVHYHLDPLTARETAQYIRHRLKVVGGAPEIFSDIASAAVYYFSGGVPRLINLLCDQAMAYGYSANQDNISLETIVEVVADRNAGGLSAFRTMPTAITSSNLVTELQSALREISWTKPDPLA